jgi:hypothetical protein
MTTTTKERPILFSAPMVRAILDGSKTQTRRVAKHPLAQAAVRINSCKGQSEFDCILPDGTGGIIQCPYGKPGDRLWVRETFAMNEAKAGPPVVYRADHGEAQSVFIERPHSAEWDVVVTRWRPSIFMPRWASRAVPEITDVRLQRLHEISEGDARAEGIDDDAADRVLMMAEAMNQREPRPFASAFETLWEDIHGSGAWHANPWVWAITFRRIQP